jgi:hypothetical protein
MKSNLFLMTESEKNRILNMHKTATSSHYLGEQAATPTTTTPAAAPATPAPAAAAPTELKSIADIQNFLIGKGFDVGKKGADGKIGPDTIAALGKFVAGGTGTAPTPTGSAEATKTAIAAGVGGTTTQPTATTTGQAAATAATPAATAATPAATATTPATTGTQPQTTNAPLADRKDIRQQNRQLKQDQRTLNRMGGKMTPQQQQAYQQSIAARTGIGAK